MLPPSGAFAVGIPGKALFVYFLTVMRATGSAHLFFATAKCAVGHPCPSVIVSRIFRLQLFLHLQQEKMNKTF